MKERKLSKVLTPPQTKLSSFAVQWCFMHKHVTALTSKDHNYNMEVEVSGLECSRQCQHAVVKDQVFQVQCHKEHRLFWICFICFKLAACPEYFPRNSNPWHQEQSSPMCTSVERTADNFKIALGALHHSGLKETCKPDKNGNVPGVQWKHLLSSGG